MPIVLARIVEISRRFALPIVALALLLAALGAHYTVRHITIDTDIEKLISPDLPWRQREAQMDRAFPQNTNLLAIVIDGRTPDETDDAAAALAARLGAEPALFKRVWRPDAGQFFRQDGLLFLSTKEVQSFADDMIAAQPLLGTIAADPSLRGVFDAIELMGQGAVRGDLAGDQLETPLTAIADATDAALAGRYAPLSWQTLLSGRKAEPRELRRFVLTQPALDYGDLEPGEPATAAIRKAAAALRLSPERGLRVRITGPVALDDDQFASLSDGAALSGTLSFGLLCFWLLLGTRSLRLTIAIFATLIVGLIACTSFAVAAVGALNPISLAFGVLFAGIAIDFGIQVCVRYRDERYQSDRAPDALRQMATGIGPSLVVAATAAAVGFLSFVPTDYTGVSSLGLIAGVGMVIALALNLTLLPALLTVLRPPAERREAGFAKLAQLDHWLVRRRGLVLTATAILVLVAAGALTRLSFDFNPLDLQDPHSEAMSTIRDLMASPETTPATIEILAASPEAASKLAARLDKLPEVAQTLTATTFIPDDQPAKLAILDDARQLLGPTIAPDVTKPPPDNRAILDAIARCATTLRPLVDKDAAATRLVRALDAVTGRGVSVLPALADNLSTGIARRIADLGLALQAQPVSLATLPAEVKNDWIAADGKARIQVFPAGNARDNDVLRRFATAVLAVAPDATGEPITIQESAHTIVRAFVVAGLVAIAAIVLLLLVVLRSIRDVAFVLVPLLLAALFTLATGAVVGLPLNFANIIALPLLLGVGVAFDIYFVMRWRDGKPGLLRSSTARGILFSGLTTGTAFGSLALSHYPATADMGLLLLIALFYTLLCTFLVLPALMGAQGDGGSARAATRAAPA